MTDAELDPFLKTHGQSSWMMMVLAEDIAVNSEHIAAAEALLAQKCPRAVWGAHSDNVRGVAQGPGNDDREVQLARGAVRKPPPQ